MRRHSAPSAPHRSGSRDVVLGDSSLRPGLRVYCVGDVHGRSDLLTCLRAAIADDVVRRPVAEAVTVFLGDYVDRGPDSFGVIDILASEPFPTAIEALRGNHEVMLLGFLADPLELGSWRRYGGLETLTSYGIPVAEAQAGSGYEETRRLFVERMPASHLAFLQNTKSSLGIDDYFFCHAGVRPGVPLSAQTARDLLWIRDDFLSHRGSFGKVVVHGHTPVAAPELHPNRINIDTRAFATGQLTCLVLEGASQAFLSGGH